MLETTFVTQNIKHVDNKEFFLFITTFGPLLTFCLCTVIKYVKLKFFRKGFFLNVGPPKEDIFLK